MNKTIPPIIAFSIIIFIAGIAGAAIFLFSQEVKDEFLIEEEAIVEIPARDEFLIEEEAIVEISAEHDFPIISTVNLIKTEFIPPCDVPEWLSYCNVDVYTYEMKLNIDEMNKWFLEEARELGWNCFSDNIESMEEIIIVGFHTECRKEETIYGLKAKRNNDIIQFILFVPRGDILY